MERFRPAPPGGGPPSGQVGPLRAPGRLPSLDAYRDPSSRSCSPPATAAWSPWPARRPRTSGPEELGRGGPLAAAVPAGEETASGSGRPRGEEVLEAIHATGAKPRWEARDQFLREHPDQGEARLEELSQAFQILRVRLLALDRDGKVRIPAWHTDPAARTAFTNPGSASPRPGRRHGRRALRRGGRRPGEAHQPSRWEHEAGAVASHLGFYDAGQSSRMRKLCARPRPAWSSA